MSAGRQITRCQSGPWTWQAPSGWTKAPRPLCKSHQAERETGERERENTPLPKPPFCVCAHPLTSLRYIPVLTFTGKSCSPLPDTHEIETLLLFAGRTGGKKKRERTKDGERWAPAAVARSRPRDFRTRDSCVCGAHNTRCAHATGWPKTKRIKTTPLTRHNRPTTTEYHKEK